MKVEFDELNKCYLCPRNCSADRSLGSGGYCKTGSGYRIASICIHHGEEPVIGGKDGICNLFFTGCNLRCRFCQNHEISQPELSDFSCLHPTFGSFRSLENILNQIESILDNGVNSVGFVSPSHVVPQVKAIIEGLRNRGRKPIFVWNSNGYEKLEVLRELEGVIDIYLPDFKYMDGKLAHDLSDAKDYPAVALSAIKEMYRQKGSVLISAADEVTQSGLIIRHLVLPGYGSNSIAVLRTIAEQISTGVCISMLAQYYPTNSVATHPYLSRSLYAEEYELVKDEFYKLGFRKGFIQELSSSAHYRPDFTQDHPFELK
jgi:putative pyruvate formate lyase activating enzyme